jgi:hypothetical protein
MSDTAEPLAAGAHLGAVRAATDGASTASTNGSAGASVHADPVGHAEPASHGNHAGETEPLGPIDPLAWGAGALGVLLGLVIALCLALATGGL